MAVEINNQLKKNMQSSIDSVRSRANAMSTAQKKAAFKPVSSRAENIGPKNTNAYQQMKKISTGGSTTKKKNSWEFRADGTRKSFNELSTPEVLTWIGTLPEEERGSAARDFETNYLKNPGSTRYDPYYTDYSNNDAARSMFGVNTFDRKWIDANRGYANYLTFSGENYTTPKKPGANASEEEKRAYEWWQIANTYEATTQAAESEYAQLRSEIQEMVRISRKAGDRLTADEILAGIDWSDYKTLQNLREASTAGNGRYLNRPVQVGDASLRSMINAALRGEDVTEARDFVYDESEYLKSGRISSKYMLPIEETQPAAQTPEAAYSPYADSTNAKYDPYYGEGSNNQAARELFGVDSFDQDWIDANRGLMAYIKFKDEDDTEPVKPGEDATEQEKAAYEYWKIANTYEETTRKAENELKTLQSWMQKQAEKLGDEATAQSILDRIDWEDEDWQDEYPTLYNMRQVAAVGNARMVNRPVGAGDESLREMAKKVLGITDEVEAVITSEDNDRETSKQGAQTATDKVTETQITAMPGEQSGHGAWGGQNPREEWEKRGIDSATQKKQETAQPTATPEAITSKEPDVQMPTALPKTLPTEEGPAVQSANLLTLLSAAQNPNQNVDKTDEATVTVEFKTPEQITAESKSENGITGTKVMIGRMLDYLDGLDALGQATEAHKAQRDEWQAEYDKLMDDMAERQEIEERVEAEARKKSVNKVIAPLRFLWNRGWTDALRDGEFVPTEDYEDFLRYRSNPAAAENAEKMAKYDRYSAAGERTSLMAEGVATGMDKAATAVTSGLEYVLYTMARWNPATKNMTKDEVYASDRFLAALKGWNDQFDKQYIDEETKAELTEQYPVVSIVSAGVSEMIKMTGQAGGALPVNVNVTGDVARYGLAFLQNGSAGMNAVQKLGKYAVNTMPFALDVYGSTYETAISEGATEDQAAAAAALNGMFTGALSSAITSRLTKLGGNITRLFTSRAGQKAAEQGAIAATKNGTINAILSIGKQLLESAVEEGFEEAIEEPIQSGISKLVYDRGRAWTGEGGVFDAKAMLESGVGGAVAGSMFTITAGASGMMGKPAKAAADQIIEAALNGEEISQSDIDRLEEIEAREAAIQDRTDDIMAADTSAIDAAKAKTDAAAENVRKADGEADQAYAQMQEEAKKAQPVLDAINQGAMSHGDPETAKAIAEAHSQVEYARKQTEEKAAAVDEAKRQHAEMLAAQREAEEQAQAAARAQATGDVDAELQQEREAEAQAAAEAAQKAAEEPETPGLKWLAKADQQTLTTDQRRQMQILDALGKEYGIEIDITDTLGPGKNGLYAGGRRITVALDATESAYVQVGVHEMVHYVRSMDGDAYSILEDVVLSHLNENAYEEEVGEILGDLVRQRIEQYEGTQELTEEQAREEIVAELVPQILTNEESARILVENNRTLAQKIRDFFIDFAAKLKRIAERYAAANDRGEIYLINENTEALIEIADVLDNALMIAGRAEKKAATQTSKLSMDSERSEAYSLKSGDDTAQLIEDVKAEEKAETLDEAARIAHKTAKDFRSTIERSEISDGIDRMIDAYQDHDEAAAIAIADELARKILDKSRKTSTDHREGYEDIRKRLRETGFSLTDTQKQEVASRLGSYNDWRKSVMGSVKVKNDAASLDAIWSQLSGMHPEYFPADANEAQMPEYIEEFVRAMRPRYENPYGMNMTEAAADLSTRLQADVLDTLGSDSAAKAAQLRNDSETYREQKRLETEDKRARQREKRAEQFKDIAGRIKKAREAGDDAAIQRALTDYRKLIGGRSHAADAIDAGIESRNLRREVRRVTGIIDNLSDMIAGEDVDFDRSKLTKQRESYEELREQLQRQADALHRQEVLDRAAIPDDELDPEMEALLAGEMQKQLDGDMKDQIDALGPEVHKRVKALWTRMKGRMQDFNMTSTIGREDLAEVFKDLEGEIVKHSELAKMWRQRAVSYNMQLQGEKTQLDYLRQDRSNARARGDEAAVNTVNSLIIEVQDRIDALNSQIKNAEMQEKYSRRIGAESLDKALSEGRLPEPIMERVIALCKDAGRRGRFNQNMLVQAAEALRLNSTTAARVWDDLFGDAAPLMRAIYYDPIMDNETARQKWIKQWRERISALELTKEQSALVQEIGEGRLNPQDDRYQQADQKVHDAVKVFREFYDEAHAMATRALERNGYEKPGKITNYFPHIETQKTWWDKLGIPMENTSLPTSINGLTDTFTPGKQYSSHLEHRYGEKTDYDALYGFEQYVGGMSNVIFHTDDIQRHRQLENEIRTTAKRGGFGDGARSEHLSEFVKWIHEYTNLLAGKKAWMDRPFEGTAGRTIYAPVTRLKSIKGASAVCGNLASAVTNMVPVTQVLAEMPVSTLKGAIQMCMGVSNGRGNIPESQYKIRKLGSDSVVQTLYTRFTHYASKPFELVDLFATNVVVNAYYQDNLRMGMDSETAMRSADNKAARLMGDRSKGAMPNIYGSQIAGFVTQFQLEVANQSQHFRKDVLRGGSWKKAMYTMLASAFTGFLWNEFNEWLTGRRPAADPFQMGIDIYNTWKNDGSPMEIGQTAYNSLSEMMPYSSMGGRVAAFDGIGTFIEALTTEGNDGSDVWYAFKQLGYGMMPGGGQLKKIVTGTQAVIEGGYYNASGTQLRYAVPDFGEDPMTALQAIMFGPSSTKAARDYYAGDAPGLTKAQTEAFEQARARGATSTEAYQNEAAKAAAARLEDKASETLNAAENAEAQARADEPYEEVDTSAVEDQKAEAADLRSEAMPGNELTDFWWERRDKPEVQAGIEIWRKTGKTWALPYAYTENKSYTIDSRKEILGSELLEEAEEMYEEGYMEIMEGVDPDKLDEEELAELEEMLEDLKAEVNSEMKKRIRKRNKENE